MASNDIKKAFKKFWWFIWEDNSIWSWLANVVIAFILIKFMVYPFLEFILLTSHPIVAVVSGSMHHEGSFDDWWESHGSWYDQVNITESQFREFPFKNGFDKGDIIVLKGKDPGDIQIGEVIVFYSQRQGQLARPDPIIHRVVEKWEVAGAWHFKTKGDFNQGFVDVGERDIHEDRIIGVGVFPIPFLGYVKIAFVALVDVIVKIIVSLRG